MRSPKNPASGAPELKLTQAEIILIQAYRKCDDESQETLIRCTVSFSKNEQLRRPEKKGPALRLVHGGSS